MGTLPWYHSSPRTLSTPSSQPSSSSSVFPPPFSLPPMHNRGSRHEPRVRVDLKTCKTCGSCRDEVGNYCVFSRCVLSLLFFHVPHPSPLVPLSHYPLSTLTDPLSCLPTLICIHLCHSHMTRIPSPLFRPIVSNSALSIPWPSAGSPCMAHTNGCVFVQASASSSSRSCSMYMRVGYIGRSILQIGHHLEAVKY
jgi:hypothetical protein